MRIILVDDESSVLPEMLATLKAMPGHEVRVATNSQKAHEHAAALGGVDLLITDVVMEPTDGFTLRAELQAVYPAMKVVFSSQYDLSDYAEHLAGAKVLAKPVTADALRTTVQSVVAEIASQNRPVAAAQPVASGVRAPVAAGQPVASGVRAPVAAGQPVASGVRAPVAAGQPVASGVKAPVAAAQPVASGVKSPVAVPQAVGRVSVPAVAPAVAQVQPVRSQPVQGIPVSGVRVSPAQVIPSPIATPGAAPRAVTAVAEQDSLIGVSLGDYRVERVIGANTWGKIYAATQTSVNRLVGLNALDPARSQNEEERAHFLAEARAKAAVSHPFIVSVFEADERNGVVFYTHEYLDGATLSEIARQRRSLDEKTALHVMKVAAEGLNYLWNHNIAHGMFDSNSIRIGNDGIARLANLATEGANPDVFVEAEMDALAKAIRALLPANVMSQGLSMLLNRMQGGANPVTGWPPVIQAVKALEPKVIPVEAAKMKAADDAAMRAVERARKAQKRALVINIATLSTFLVVLTWLVLKYAISNERKLDAQIEVPAGTYLIGESGESVQLPGFEIDRFEVSIGRYAKFIEWCQKAENPFQFDHPLGRREISHINAEVNTLIANAKARDARVFKDAAKNEKGTPVDLNSPIVGISWWDAYAFAKWEGKIMRGGEERDLPREEEWEAAARGTKGFKYPWGDTFEPKKTNSGVDYQPLKPGAEGDKDGYNYWAPVDALKSDKSPLNVEGMGGNVMEWVYRKQGNKEIPALKGGSFATVPTAMFERIMKVPAEDCWLIYPASQKGSALRAGQSERIYVNDDIKPETRALYIGFRTVRRK